MHPSIQPEVEVLRSDAPMATKIAAAARLWHLSEDIKAVLEHFKTEVRKVALETGKSVVTLDGEGLSQVKVIVPGPSLRLMDGLTVQGERDALGEWFNAVYEVKLNLRSANPAAVATFSPSVRSHMAEVTTLVENPPRVSLRHLQGVEEVK